MTDRERRTAVEVFIGKPRAWVVCAWSALAVVWIIMAVVTPSGFRTFMAIAWSLLAVCQIVAFSSARRQRRSEAEDHLMNGAPR